MSTNGGLRFYRSGKLALTAVLVLAGLIAPVAAQAVDTPSSLYECQPRDPHMAKPPPLPELSPQAAAEVAKAIESDDFTQVCPAGEVPQPTATGSDVSKPPPVAASDAVDAKATGRLQLERRGKGHRSRRHRPRSRGASASRQQPGGPGSGWYSYAIGMQGFNAGKGVNGLWAIQTNEEPYVANNESDKGHSISQLWAVDSVGSCWSDSEIGWRASPASFSGDTRPHLFMFAFDCGNGLGYAGSGLPWVQNSSVVFPNSVLTHNDVFHAYGARMDGNNWWFYYDGQWVGYIPHEAWKSLYPSVITTAQAGGEVATSAYSTCTDMGYAGLFGGHPWAAMYETVWYEYNYQTQASSASLSSFSSDPSYYATGNWYNGNPGNKFRYGGPGWC